MSKKKIRKRDAGIAACILAENALASMRATNATMKEAGQPGYYSTYWLKMQETHLDEAWAVLKPKEKK